MADLEAARQKGQKEVLDAMDAELERFRTEYAPVPEGVGRLMVAAGIRRFKHLNVLVRTPKRVWHSTAY